MTEVEVEGLFQGPDGAHRCWWCSKQDDYRAYHDTEWGWPQSDDRRLFEKLCLEAFQSGLSWYTILRRREGFRAAFHHFEAAKVAAFTEDDIEGLLQDTGIIRHRGKIEACIHNAGLLPEIVSKHGSLAALVWSFEPKPEDRPTALDFATLSRLTETPASRALSKTLRALGWKFVGPTTAYAFMQSVGIVNDHLEGCAARAHCEQARADFKRPA